MHVACMDSVQQATGVSKRGNKGSGLQKYIRSVSGNRQVLVDEMD